MSTEYFEVVHRTGERSYLTTEDRSEAKAKAVELLESGVDVVLLQVYMVPRVLVLDPHEPF